MEFNVRFNIDGSAFENNLDEIGEVLSAIAAAEREGNTEGIILDKNRSQIGGWEIRPND